MRDFWLGGLIGALFVCLIIGPSAQAAFQLEWDEDAPRQGGIVGTPGGGTTLASKAVSSPVERPYGWPRVSGGTDPVWDRLAQCESGGNWQVNTGNGYSGGLQFLPSTWRAAGGTQYAPLPHQATREQQIAVASSWLAKTSWAQWPACSRRLGLR